jgi:hypothetical protein
MGSLIGVECKAARETERGAACSVASGQVRRVACETEATREVGHKAEHVVVSEVERRAEKLGEGQSLCQRLWS